MNYNVLIYGFCITISVIVVSAINFNNFFKTGKEIEANMFVVIISLIMGYLLGEFVISFLNITSII